MAWSRTGQSWSREELGLAGPTQSHGLSSHRQAPAAHPPRGQMSAPPPGAAASPDDGLQFDGSEERKRKSRSVSDWTPWTEPAQLVGTMNTRPATWGKAFFGWRSDTGDRPACWSADDQQGRRAVTGWFATVCKDLGESLELQQARDVGRGGPEGFQGLDVAEAG